MQLPSLTRCMIQLVSKYMLNISIVVVFPFAFSHHFMLLLLHSVTDTVRIKDTSVHIHKDACVQAFTNC